MSANALGLLLMVVISWPVAALVAGDPLMAALGIVAGRGARD